MGLFSNKKKLCPICGNPTPRLFPQKFDDQPVCKECAGKIDLPSGAEDHMTLADFRQYLADFEENQQLLSQFQKTFRIAFAFTPILLDEKNGFFCRQEVGSRWIFEKKNLKSFRILEDESVLFESSNGTLNCYASDIPARAEALLPLVRSFHAEKREYERRENMERMRNLDETDEQRRERLRITETYRPYFDDPELFHKFRLEVVLDHPYWQNFEEQIQAPSFDRQFPSVENYMKQYREQVEELRQFAQKLMKMIDPDAKET